MFEVSGCQVEEIQPKSGPFRLVPQVTADLINLEIQGLHHEGCGGGREVGLII